MFVNPLLFRRSPVPGRLFCGLLSMMLLGAAPAMAAQHKPAARTHPRLRAAAHAFVNATLPAAGLLTDDDEDLPTDGQKYELKLALARTGEVIDVVYRIGDTYIPGALDQLNEFLRDSHNEEIAAYDPKTFDLLHTVLAKLGRTNSVVNILSGYRSQETNDELRASGLTNAAEHSQHILAKAMDIRVAGVSAAMLRDACCRGRPAGYYPASQFGDLDAQGRCGNGPSARICGAGYAGGRRSGEAQASGVGRIDWLLETGALRAVGGQSESLIAIVAQDDDDEGLSVAVLDRLASSR